MFALWEEAECPQRTHTDTGKHADFRKGHSWPTFGNRHVFVHLWPLFRWHSHLAGQGPHYGTQWRWWRETWCWTWQQRLQLPTSSYSHQTQHKDFTCLIRQGINCEICTFLMTKLVLDEAALPVLFENLNFNSVSTCISSECDFYPDFKGRFFTLLWATWGFSP